MQSDAWLPVAGCVRLCFVVCVVCGVLCDGIPPGGRLVVVVVVIVGVPCGQNSDPNLIP